MSIIYLSQVHMNTHFKIIKFTNISYFLIFTLFYSQVDAQDLKIKFEYQLGCKHWEVYDSISFRSLLSEQELDEYMHNQALFSNNMFSFGKRKVANPTYKFFKIINPNTEEYELNGIYSNFHGINTERKSIDLLEIHSNEKRRYTFEILSFDKLLIMFYGNYFLLRPVCKN